MLPLLRHCLLSCSMLRLLRHRLNIGATSGSSCFVHSMRCTPRMILLLCVEVSLLLRRTGRVLIQASIHTPSLSIISSSSHAASLSALS